MTGQTGFHYDYPVPCTNPACRNRQVAAGEATP